jgi:hypothetical protein
MHEAMKEWGRSYNFFLRLEREGRLLGIWVGQRVYFSRAQLLELLGEPANPGPQRAHYSRHQNRVLNGDSDLGGYQQGSFFDSAAAAA